MNDASADNQVKHQFAIAVKNYAPKVSRKYQQLLILKAGIAELRLKGASYKSIAEILHHIGVSVSHATVARFCCEVLQPRKATVSTPSQEQRSQTHITHADNHSARRKVQTDGPRVADPNTI